MLIVRGPTLPRLIAYKIILKHEPTNPVDSNAIIVEICLKDGSYIPIGYVVKELVHDVHPFLSELRAFITSVRYRSAFKREGYYAIINLVKEGAWSKKVVAAGRCVS